MKAHPVHSRITTSLALVATLTLPTLASGPAANAKAPTQQEAKGTPAKPAEPEIPLSVFVVPATPKEGRNPFFPQSTLAAPVAKAAPAALDASALVLNGITSPPKRTAMINGRTFEEGEEAEVKLPTGSKVLVKCKEIRDESAIVLVNGQSRELHLRFGI